MEPFHPPRLGDSGSTTATTEGQPRPHHDSHADDTDEDDEGHDPYDDDYTDSEGEGNTENDWSGDIPSYTEIDVDDSMPAIPWKDRLLKVISFFDKYNSDHGFSLLKSAGVHAYHQKKFCHALDAFVFAALTAMLTSAQQSLALTTPLGGPSLTARIAAVPNGLVICSASTPFRTSTSAPCLCSSSSPSTARPAPTCPELRASRRPSRSL